MNPNDLYIDLSFLFFEKTSYEEILVSFVDGKNDIFPAVFLAEIEKIIQSSHTDSTDIPYVELRYLSAYPDMDILSNKLILNGITHTSTDLKQTRIFDYYVHFVANALNKKYWYILPALHLTNEIFSFLLKNSGNFNHLFYNRFDFQDSDVLYDFTGNTDFKVLENSYIKNLLNEITAFQNKLSDQENITLFVSHLNNVLENKEIVIAKFTN